MNEIAKTTITSMEVAEMVEKEHSKLLKDIRRYVEQLGEAKIGFTEFFTESTYTTVQNKVMPCYLVTKKGCEFIAHKLTGRKGTEFTARYINRFHEMEDGIYSLEYRVDPATLKGAASAGCLIERAMKAQGSKPYEVTKVLDALFRQSGIILPDCFVKIPQYEQMELSLIYEGKTTCREKTLSR